MCHNKIRPEFKMIHLLHHTKKTVQCLTVLKDKKLFKAVLKTLLNYCVTYNYFCVMILISYIYKKLFPIFSLYTSCNFDLFLVIFTHVSKAAKPHLVRD